MKRILIFVTVLVFIAGMTTSAFAQMGHGMKGPRGDGPRDFDHGGMRGHGGILGCKSELGLNEDQVAKIKDYQFAHQNAMIDLQADLKKAQLKMKQEAHADNPNKTVVLAAAREVNVIKGRIAEARINHRFDVRSVLDKEQLDKWKECKMDFRGKRGGHDKGGRFHEGHPPMGQGDMRRDGSCMTGR